jgi:SAM-dependent methyltransferase
MSLGRFAALCVLGLMALGVAARLIGAKVKRGRVHWLLAGATGPLRGWGLEPRTVARRVGLRAGMRVLVVDGGYSRTVRAIAREVGKTGFVESIATSAAEAKNVRAGCVESTEMSIVHVVASALDRVPFADTSFDAVCYVAAFGTLADPVEVLSESWRVLRPTGRLSASETIGRPGFRLRRSVELWGEAVGFERLEYFGSPFAYTVNFRKPIGGTATG